MGWIDDVFTDETIYSSSYGNPIRDRTVHQFANKPERDASTSKFSNGMVAYTATERIWWVRRDAAWWPLSMPARTFTPHLWVYDGTNWVGATVGGDLRVAEVSRHVDWCFLKLWCSVGVLQGGAPAPVAVGLPYPPAVQQVSAPVGNGWVFKSGNGPVVGGGAFITGPIGAYWTVSPTDVVTGAAALIQTNQAVALDLSWRTTQSDDVPL